MKSNSRKLKLSAETITHLNSTTLNAIRGGFNMKSLVLSNCVTRCNGGMVDCIMPIGNNG